MLDREWQLSGALLFKHRTHGFKFSRSSDVDNRQSRRDTIFLKHLGIRPDLPAEASWESQQCGADNIPLMRLYCADNKYFMEYSCQGKGIFVFQREKNTIEIYWGDEGTGFQHYLLTNGLAVVLEFRGIPCLHGNTLAWKGKGFGLLGTSTAGKSTLSAALAMQGCQVMSDDMLSLRLDLNHWRVSASLPVLRLWQDSIAELYCSDIVATAPRVHEPFNKYSLDAGCLDDLWSKNDSLNLTALYLLDRKDSPGMRPECWIEDLTPADALIALIRESVLSNATKALGIETHRMKKLGRLVSEIPVKRLCYTSGYDYLPEVCEKVINDLGAH